MRLTTLTKRHLFCAKEIENGFTESIIAVTIANTEVTTLPWRYLLQQEKLFENIKKKLITTLSD